MKATLSKNVMRALHLSLLGLCLLLFTSFATTDLALPGLQYDEASHACLTLDMLNPKNPFSPTYTITLFRQPFPFGTDPHTGASKAYIFYPFFLLFGPGVESQRSATLLFGGIGPSFLLPFHAEELWCLACLLGSSCTESG